MNTWYYNSLPAWMKSNPGQQPFNDVLAGRPTQNFNPGAAFGTNAGQGGATLPSVQRWNHLAPSEQAGAQGQWSDQYGINPDDVMSLMNKLRPTTSYGSAAPRWSY